MAKRGKIAVIVVAALVSACTSHRRQIAVVAEPPPVATPSTVAVPPADAAMIWHLRIALNVAALICRGHGSNELVSGYNAMLTSRRVQLDAAQAVLAARYGGATSSAYDSAMTRLYNFYALPTATAAFCPVAMRVQHDVPDVADAHLAEFAVQALADLNAPFTPEGLAATAPVRQHVTR
ncbi:hypothetical protein ACLB0R_12615 [Sphingomonas sp. GlSt437]|uniref:hypothetical protein n=1 Tax=Sphingomonas sp. GlSt437 TaxID=3389970 RepID=UPI003A8B3EBE